MHNFLIANMAFYNFLSSVAQSCLTLCDPMFCNLPGSFVHGIFQASILVAISSSRDLPNSGIKPVSLRSPALAGRFFTISTTWEAFPQLSKGVE